MNVFIVEYGMMVWFLVLPSCPGRSEHVRDDLRGVSVGARVINEYLIYMDDGIGGI